MASHLEVSTEGATAGLALLMLPPEAGRQIVAAVEKGSYEIFIGSDARFMSRMARLSPKRAAALIYSQMKDLLGH